MVIIMNKIIFCLFVLFVMLLIGCGQQASPQQTSGEPGNPLLDTSGQVAEPAEPGNPQLNTSRPVK